ncbi:hypothetical protein BGZ54_010183 [Gamsiella multidivaricata]|nr:hypothetical protein BGZ54_010183 [Gamsiella multidivaricata]
MFESSKQTPFKIKISKEESKSNEAVDARTKEIADSATRTSRTANKSSKTNAISMKATVIEESMTNEVVMIAEEVMVNEVAD